MIKFFNLWTTACTKGKPFVQPKLQPQPPLTIVPPHLKPLAALTNLPNNTSMRIGYMRVSDFEQTENLQFDALQAANCDVIFSDCGVSGSKTERQGLSELFAKLGKSDTLVVWKLDRLGRSTIHLLLMLDELRKKGIDFVAITQGIDTTTAIGRMLFGQLGVFAEFEREQIRERTKAGMQAAKARGKHVGRPRKLTLAQVEDAARVVKSKELSLAAMSRRLKVSRAILLL